MHGTLQLLVLDLPVVEKAQLAGWVPGRVPRSLQSPRRHGSFRFQVERLGWNSASLEEHVSVLIDWALARLRHGRPGCKCVKGRLCLVEEICVHVEVLSIAAVRLL